MFTTAASIWDADPRHRILLIYFIYFLLLGFQKLLAFNPRSKVNLDQIAKEPATRNKRW